MKAVRLSSAQRAIDLRQSPPPLIIGERVNAQGSKKAKQMVLEDDFDGLAALARSQVEDGAHCLDVCVAVNERSDEKEFMAKLVKKISQEVAAPLVIDSTDPDVMEAALRQAPGLPLINSINLEGDGSRFSRIAPLMKKYGAPAIAMCIGPKGMAKTPAEKLEVAELVVAEGAKYGLGPEMFAFDVAVFTMGTGDPESRTSALDALEGIRLIKKRFPASHTAMGLSNVSFGLNPPARRLINSVFLYHAVRAGLDCAIVNARDITPYMELDPAEREMAEDLLLAKSDDALPKIIGHFEGRTGGAAKKEDKMDPSWTAGKRCHYRIVGRIKEGIQGDVTAAISEKAPGGSLDGASAQEAHDAAVRTLNEDLLPAMKEVGDLFGAGELILPFVLGSAECMKAAVSELEKRLIKKDGASKGKIVLGTVAGDVHDIGKNLVKTIFENNGYTVYDLGKQVPLNSFLEKIDETSPDAVGLSALLVSTSKEMMHFVEHARKAGMSLPVLCGGAAVNSTYINRIAKEGGIYEPGVFYCNTMFEGLKVMDQLVSDGRAKLVSDWKARLEKWVQPEPRKKSSGPARSSVRPVSPPAIPASYSGPAVLRGGEIDFGQVWKLLDIKSLFKMSWGLRGKAGASQVQNHEELLEQWKAQIKDDCLFEPMVSYGYFACSAKGDALQVGKHPFEFPRSSNAKRLCLADYFGENDVVALQAVTVGQKAADQIEEWNRMDRYTDAYYLHGLAVEAAEALASWANRRICSELGLEEGRGLRYSWGYPSCPDVSQHQMVWDLLGLHGSGMELTSAGQIIPEQSTAAIIVHHPEAEYFT